MTEYVTALCDLFDAIPLDERGSLWVNLGDKRHDGALLGVPLRFALAMQDRGWRLIDSVAWVKGVVHIDGSVRGSYLPEPANGRLNGNAWENLFRFSRSTHPWSDDCAVRIPRSNVPDIRHLPEELMRCHTAIEGRVPPNVWLCPPGKSHAGHFAAFDRSLIERCVAMTCPPWINGNGSPVERQVEMIPYIEGRGRDRYVGKRSQIAPDDAGKMRKRCGRNDTGRTYTPRKPVTLVGCLATLAVALALSSTPSVARARLARWPWNWGAPSLALICVRSIARWHRSGAARRWRFCGSEGWSRCA